MHTAEFLKNLDISKESKANSKIFGSQRRKKKRNTVMRKDLKMKEESRKVDEKRMQTKVVKEEGIKKKN